MANITTTSAAAVKTAVDAILARCQVTAEAYTQAKAISAECDSLTPALATVQADFDTLTGYPYVNSDVWGQAKAARALATTS